MKIHIEEGVFGLEQTRNPRYLAQLFCQQFSAYCRITDVASFKEEMSLSFHIDDSSVHRLVAYDMDAPATEGFDLGRRVPVGYVVARRLAGSSTYSLLEALMGVQEFKDEIVGVDKNLRMWEDFAYPTTMSEGKCVPNVKFEPGLAYPPLHYAEDFDKLLPFLRGTEENYTQKVKDTVSMRFPSRFERAPTSVSELDYKIECLVVDSRYRFSEIGLQLMMRLEEDLKQKKDAAQVFSTVIYDGKNGAFAVQEALGYDPLLFVDEWYANGANAAIMGKSLC